MNNPTTDFAKHWEFIHAMTLDFAAEVPEASWDFSPHPKFAPFSKQLRHVVCVRGVYNDALVSRRADFSRKHEHYDGPLTREALTSALAEQQDALLAILTALEKESDAIVIEAFGRQFPLGEYLHILTQHESLHQGQWSIYAALAAFETPLRWRLEWAL